MGALDYGTRIWDSRSVTCLAEVDWRLACIVTSGVQAFLWAREKEEKVFSHCVRVTSGLRDAEEQRKLYDAGASKTLRSHHLTGMAVDLAYIRAGKARWELDWYRKLDEFIQKATLSFGLDAGDVVWGGHWTTLRDGCHWQLMLPPLPSHI